MNQPFPEPVEFEASGLPCIIVMTVPGAWLCCAQIERGHALYRRRRDVEIEVPDAFAGQNVALERVSYADMCGAPLPTVLEAGMNLPASILLACPNGIMYTGVAYDGRPGKWWIGFNMPGDSSQDEIRAELDHFAALVDALANATVTGGPAAYPEI
jgi:hypothetical protein